MNLQYPKILEKISDKSGHNPHHVFRAFVRLAACCLTGPDFKLAITANAIQRNLPNWSRIALIGDREADYLEEAGRWNAETLALFGQALGALMLDVDRHEFEDVLGSVHMDWMGRNSQQWNAEFHTPMAVAGMMGRINAQGLEIAEGGHTTVMDPAAGSGNLILGFAEALHEQGHPLNIMRATLADISPTARDMAFINMTLHGIPAVIVHADTLKMQVWHWWHTPFWPLARGATTTRESLARNPLLQYGPTTDPTPDPTPEPPRPLQIAATESGPRPKKLEKLLEAQSSLFDLKKSA